MTKKLWVVIPSFCCLCSLIFAQSPDISFSQLPACPPTKAVTPAARTCSELNGVYVTGEFIYWKARIDDLVFAAFEKITTIPNGVQRTYRPFEPNSQYDPGFKLGLGGTLPFDGWGLYLNWTHFHTVRTITKSSSQANIVDWESIQEQEDFAARKLKQSWNLMFNSLDFDWGRRFYVSHTLTIRPSFGGKVAWVHQKIRTSFFEAESIETGLPAAAMAGQKARNDFWGIGPYLAFQGKWTFGYGFGLFGQLSGALLWGEFQQESSQLSNEDRDGQGISTTSAKVFFEAHRVRPTTQAFIGLDWEWCFIPKWLSLNLRAGYETQFYWSQFINSVQDIDESNLTFEGFTFMGRIDF